MSKNIIKVIISIFIIYLLVKFNIINFLVFNNLLNNFHYVVYILILMLITIPIGTFRWWLLLCSEKYNISYKNTYILYSTGLFFNIFMPGGAGGDLVKGFYLYKYVKKNQKTLAIFTIFVDRAIGLHSLLFIISTFGFIVSSKIFSNADLNHLFHLILLFMIFSIPLIFLLINFSVFFLEKLNKSNPNIFVDFIKEILKSLMIYKNRKLVLFKCWLLSLINHSCILSCFYLTSLLLDINIMLYFEAAFIGGISLITNSIPLTPGGIGIGETAFNYISQFFYKNENIAFGSIFFVTLRVLFNLVCLTGVASFVTLKSLEISKK